MDPTQKKELHMIPLTQQKCVPCQKGAPLLTQEKLETLKPQIPDWEVTDTHGIPKLAKAFTFKNFKGALAFVNAVGDLAEAHFHHPTLILDWGRVKVLWTTHKINGLHENDVIMAARTDEVFSKTRA
jgi:4a-hydroxytetrahydrobiopterin dehydratase